MVRKRSASIIAGLAATLVGCDSSPQRAKAPDPCEPRHFSEKACKDAVAGGGYHSNGVWVPMQYSHPYPYYYGNYGSYVSRGGSASPAPASAYAPAISRGGFGGTAAGEAGE